MIFTDERINEVLQGFELTKQERQHLVSDTPRFEECDKTEEELSIMPDKQLMGEAYRVWAEYVSSMY